MAAQAISPNVTADQIATPALAASIPACDAGVGGAAGKPALSSTA
jgi:hypothetical protein